MRLLETSKIELHEFFDAQIPEYAILSHRWEEGEVTFRLFQSQKGLGMTGYQKIRNTCAKAAADGWEYVWIDSCCIDKSSSAELSEAINSMYKWYANAKVCYAYLCDVDARQNLESSLRLSQWFTRGWTLQELLAPSLLEFYDQNWNEIGTKQSMSWLLEDITGISGDILSGSQTKWDLNTCIAEKMSWAARRETTRAEDLAYCLIGLFDINMPLLYGEGAQRAFIRLQAEIMGKTADESIFAWNYPESNVRFLPLLAEHPSWFANSGGTSVSFSATLVERSSMHQMTGRGVRIEALCIPNQETDIKLTLGPVEQEGFLMPLKSCRQETFKDRDHYNVLAIQMIKAKILIQGFSGYQWYRRPHLELVKFRNEAVEGFRDRDREIIFVPQIKPPAPESFSPSYQARTLIRIHNIAEYGFTLVDDNGWSTQCNGVVLHNFGPNTGRDIILEYSPIYELSEAEYGLLFRNRSMRFALLIQFCHHVSCDLQSGVPSPRQMFLEGKNWKKPDIPFWTSPGVYTCLHQDRCSYCLNDNLYVSASVKLGKESGNLVNIVDVKIGTQGRWVKRIKL